jgi:Zn ribbon nucleic-acid-binding protein
LRKLNSCPKCDSDTFVYQTVSGNKYEECFRCGYRNKLDCSVDAEEILSEASLGQAEGSAQRRK